MSYLLQYAARRPASAGRFGRRGAARVDIRKRLNQPGLYGDAYVRVYVEDTSHRRCRRGANPPEPRLKLRIADCVNVIALEFDLDTPQLRDNALHKIDTLLGALHAFRDGLADEAELYARREVTR